MKCDGFTLLELLLTLALVALLYSLALPTYHALVANNRITTEADQLVTTIHFARSEAIKRHMIITLCKSHDEKTCSGQWQEGWIVFTDSHAKGQVSPGDGILRVHSSLSQDKKLVWQGSRSHNYLQMSPTGSTHGQAGTFIFCRADNPKKAVRAVVVSQTGRVRIETNPGQNLHCN